MFETVKSHVGDVSVLDIAREYGSPTYVYEAQIIRDRIEQLKMFDVIRFAQKANSNLAVLKLMRENGVLVDAVSAGEIFRAEKAGYSVGDKNNSVVYTADIFDSEALSMVVEKNIPVNIGSPDMIQQLGAVAPGREITLRINPGFGHGHSQKTNTGGEHSKHGVWHDQIDKCLALAAQNDLSITGLHMHIGSGTDFEHLSQVCEAMEKTAIEIGASIKTISAGGGLPTPYKSGEEHIDLNRYFELWDSTRKRLESAFGHEVSLEIEPGRFLVAECGSLICEIRAVKQVGGNLFYLVDAGFNNLARPAMYGAYHPMSIAFQNDHDDVVHQEVVVGGPLCESGDIFTQEEGGFVCSRELPVASVGDFLVIGCAGAYGFVMSSNYNSKPMAAEVLVDGGQPMLIRKRQTFSDLIAGEILPG